MKYHATIIAPLITMDQKVIEIRVVDMKGVELYCVWRGPGKRILARGTFPRSGPRIEQITYSE